MRKYVWIALASFLLGLFVAGYVFVYLPDKKAPQKSFLEQGSESPLSPNLFASSAPEIQASLDFVAISEKVGPAVVRIDAEGRQRRRLSGSDEDWPFEDFWDRFFGRPAPREQDIPVMTQGSGFFISTDGYLITNNHIVDNAVKVTVFTVQGEEYVAKVVGTDVRTDLALLKIEAKDLSFVELGDSAQLKVGEWVLAIGNPLGMEHTVTAGIVSAKGRQLGTGANVPYYQDFIQTDTAINRGNSGGPLVNMRGEVIGITSNILSPTGGSIGIGFAIPSSLAKKVVIQLKEKGRVIRGKIGVNIQAITEGIQKQLNLKDRKGALINNVDADSPAEKAELKRYDVIIAVNGQPVSNTTDLRFKIADIEPGKKVDLTIIRDGKDMNVSVTIEEMDPEEEKGTSAGTDKDIGISVTPLTANLARRYGLKTMEGLLITQVRPYSEADRKGLQEGEIILEANRKKTPNARDLESILKKAEPGEEIILLVRTESEGQTADRIVTIRIPG